MADTIFTNDFDESYVKSPDDVQTILNTNVPCTLCNLLELVDTHEGGPEAIKGFVAALKAEPKFVEKVDLIRSSIEFDPKTMTDELVANVAAIFFFGGQLLFERDTLDFTPKGSPFGPYDTPIVSKKVKFPDLEETESIREQIRKVETEDDAIQVFTRINNAFGFDNAVFGALKDETDS